VLKGTLTEWHLLCCMISRVFCSPLKLGLVNLLVWQSHTRWPQTLEHCFAGFGNIDFVQGFPGSSKAHLRLSRPKIRWCNMQSYGFASNLIDASFMTAKQLIWITISFCVFFITFIILCFQCCMEYRLLNISAH